MVEGVLWTGIALLALVSAGPLERYPRDAEDYQNIDLSAYANFTANEVCFSDNEVFQKGDLMPNPGPCEECRCEPPSIVCQMVKCPVNNNGCRTIQRANRCCPDYNCECDYNGQLYNDGERLDLPDQPCQVCYCKGGEVMCTSLTCYTRNDCEPQHIPGQCCPKYINCPLRDMAVGSNTDKTIRARSPNKTMNSPKREMQPWLLTSSAQQMSSAPVTKQPLEVTTSDGTVIIVSDWLTERKTTPEDTQLHTSHDTTESHHLKTEQTAKPTSDHYTTKSAYASNSLPSDEVIFTRIDVLKSQDKNIASTTNFITNLLEESGTTNIPVRSSISESVVYETIDSKNSGSTKTPNYSTSPGTDIYRKEKQLSSDEKTTDQPSNSISYERQHNFDSTSPGPSLSTDKANTTENVKNKEIEMYVDDNISSNQKPIKQLAEKNISAESDITVNDIKYESLNEERESKTNIKSNYVSDLNDIQLLTTVTPQHPSPIQTESSDYPEGADSLSTNENTSTNLIEYTTTKMDVTTDSQIKLRQIDKQRKINDTILPNIVANNMKQEDSSVTELNTSILTTDVTETTTMYFTEDHMVVFEAESEKNQKHKSETEENHSFSNEKFTKNMGINQHSLVIRGEASKIDSTIQPMEGINELPIDTTESKETTTDLNKQSDQPSGSIVVLSSEEAQFYIREINPTENLTDSHALIGSEHLNEDQTTSHNNPTLRDDADVKNTSEQLQGDSQENSNDVETSTLEISTSDHKNENSAAHVPPILDLNSDVPFLLVGGIESSESLEEANTIETVTEELESDKENLVSTVTPKDIIFTNAKFLMDSSGANKNTSNTNETIASTSDTLTTASTYHIPLTPGDLKVLAEYLINESIKPATTGNDSTYIPNQWLQGNLTSEDKMSSIMTAANVNVSIMNETNGKLNTKLSNLKAINSEKFDKDRALNSNALKLLAKEEIDINQFHGKEMNKKDNVKTEQHLNDVAPIASSASTQELINPMINTATTPNLDQIPYESIGITNDSNGKRNMTDSRTHV